MQEIANLAQLTGGLLAKISIPLHFLKIIDFEADSLPENEEAIDSVNKDGKTIVSINK